MRTHIFYVFRIYWYFIFIITFTIRTVVIVNVAVNIVFQLIVSVQTYIYRDTRRVNVHFQNNSCPLNVLSSLKIFHHFYHIFPCYFLTLCNSYVTSVWYITIKFIKIVFIWNFLGIYNVFFITKIYYACASLIFNIIIFNGYGECNIFHNSFVTNVLSVSVWIFRSYIQLYYMA